MIVCIAEKPSVAKDIAKARYRKKTKQIAVEFNTETESDILNFLLGKSNRQGYIKELIRKDMESV